MYRKFLNQDKNLKKLIDFVIYFPSLQCYLQTATWAQGNNLIYISGKVIDKETGKAIEG